MYIQLDMYVSMQLLDVLTLAVDIQQLSMVWCNSWVCIYDNHKWTPPNIFRCVHNSHCYLYRGVVLSLEAVHLEIVDLGYDLGCDVGSE